MRIAAQGAGMDLRGPLIGIYAFPTLVIFCEGAGIAAARALLQAAPSEGGLSFQYREDVRMYYRVRFFGFIASWHGLNAVGFVRVGHMWCTRELSMACTWRARL